MGEPFKHNSHQAAIIILVILYFAYVVLLILYNNHVYIVFTTVLVGLGKIFVRNSFWSCLLVIICIFPNYNIVFQFKPFGVVFLSLSNLI